MGRFVAIKGRLCIVYLCRSAQVNTILESKSTKVSDIDLP